MLPPDNQPLDIEVLMERIRREVIQRRNQAAPAVIPAPSKRYAPGQLLRFGIDGSAGPYLGSGWALPEPGFQWTDGEVAELDFTFEKIPGDLVLSFTVNPLTGAGIETQEVSALWNDTFVGRWTIRENTTYHTLILAQSSENPLPASRLKFKIPTSFSPISKGLGADPRRLGLAFTELVLRPAHDLGFQ